MSLNKRLFGQDPVASGAYSFKVLNFTGNGGTNAVTGVGFAPDIVWIKDTDTGYQHNIYDTSRGTGAAGFALEPSGTANEYTLSGLTAFGSDGFTVGSNAGNNQGSSPNLAFCWGVNGGTTSTDTNGSINSTVQVNQAGGVSIVKFTGNQTAGATVGHGLGVAPNFILMTNRTRNGYGWYTYSSVSGATKNLVFNTSDGEATATQTWNDTEPTSTVFSLGTETGTNSNNYPYIAYCFANKSGQQKFGEYTANGGGSNNAITGLGFQPDFLILRNTGSDNWRMYNSARDLILYGNLNNAGDGYGNQGHVSFNSDGFTLLSDNNNAPSGRKHLYLAWKNS